MLVDSPNLSIAGYVHIATGQISHSCITTYCDSDNRRITGVGYFSYKRFIGLLSPADCFTLSIAGYISTATHGTGRIVLLSYVWCGLYYTDLYLSFIIEETQPGLAHARRISESFHRRIHLYCHPRDRSHTIVFLYKHILYSICY